MENQSDAVLGTGETAMNKTDKVCALMDPTPRWGETGNKQRDK